MTSEYIQPSEGGAMEDFTYTDTDTKHETNTSNDLERKIKTETDECKHTFQCCTSGRHRQMLDMPTVRNFSVLLYYYLSK
jgi:hypothetical protein